MKIRYKKDIDANIRGNPRGQYSSPSTRKKSILYFYVKMAFCIPGKLKEHLVFFFYQEGGVIKPKFTQLMPLIFHKSDR